MTRKDIDMRVRIVLWDLGRVLLDWDPERAYFSRIEDAGERALFLRDVCNMDWHKHHDAGVSFADNAASLIKRFPQHEANIRAWRTGWFDMFDSYIDGTPALFERLDATGIDQYALSNMPAEIWPGMLTHFPLLTRFRDVIVSGEEKLIKPDPAIYKLALGRMGNPAPEDVLFIDDSAANIDAAKALGFQTHLMKNAAGLETALMHYRLI